MVLSVQLRIWNKVHTKTFQKRKFLIYRLNNVTYATNGVNKNLPTLLSGRPAVVEKGNTNAKTLFAFQVPLLNFLCLLPLVQTWRASGTWWSTAWPSSSSSSWSISTSCSSSSGGSWRSTSSRSCPATSSSSLWKRCDAACTNNLHFLLRRLIWLTTTTLRVSFDFDSTLLVPGDDSLRGFRIPAAS